MYSDSPEAALEMYICDLVYACGFTKQNENHYTWGKYTVNCSYPLAFKIEEFEQNGTITVKIFYIFDHQLCGLPHIDQILDLVTMLKEHA